MRKGNIQEKIQILNEKITMHCLEIKRKKTVQLKIKKVHDSIFRVGEKAHL